MNIKLNKKIYDDNYLGDKYSKYAEDEEKIEGIPYINFPFEVVEMEREYKYLSWILIDYDSNPVVQFSWIHWMIANFEVTGRSQMIPENLIESGKSYIGGTNSFAGPLTKVKDEKIILNYGGPTPPDKDHVYTLVAYNHNEKLNLNKGFYYNEFIDELEKSNNTCTKVKILAKK